MATIVLRVRLTGGDRMDITYEDPDVVDDDELVELVISTLAQDSGVLRSQHGGRLLVLYGRGVAAVEVAPRGAVLYRHRRFGALPVTSYAPSAPAVMHLHTMP